MIATLFLIAGISFLFGAACHVKAGKPSLAALHGLAGILNCIAGLIYASR